jgi:phage baseplate assembly protein W
MKVFVSVLDTPQGERFRRPAGGALIITAVSF